MCLEDCSLHRSVWRGERVVQGAVCWGVVGGGKVPAGVGRARAGLDQGAGRQEQAVLSVRRLMWRARGWVTRGRFWEFPERRCGGGGGVCVSLVCVAG